MTKNQTIAILVEGKPDTATQTEAENLQYNLLGRGFRWASGGSSSKDFIGLSGFARWTLYVDTKTKLMNWSPENNHDKAAMVAYHVINLWSAGLPDTIRTIVNPPTPPPEYDLIQGVPEFVQTVRVFPNGKVEFWEDGDNMLTTNKDTIAGVAKSLGLPTENKIVVTVRFAYPDSSRSWNPVERAIQVTGMDDEFIAGVELYRGGVETNTYKKYRISKINGNIELVTFSKE